MLSELLEAGHSHEALWHDYCIEEIELHYESMLRVRSKSTQRFAIAVRAATQANKRGWRDYMKHLDTTWREIEKAAGRTIHNQGAFFRGLGKMKASAKRRGRPNGND